MDSNISPVIIVPARLASVRFPKKLLADACGKPLILRTADRIKEQVPEFELYFAVDGDELKNILGVNSETIDKYSVVSSNVANEMALEAKNFLDGFKILDRETYDDVILRLKDIVHKKIILKAL